jgi:hypothetical protein
MYVLDGLPVVVEYVDPHHSLEMNPSPLSTSQNIRPISHRYYSISLSTIRSLYVKSIFGDIGLQKSL